MNRFVIPGLMALTVGSSVISTAGAAGAPQPRARLRGFVCQRAVEPSQREMSIDAVMRPLTATKKMAMRFELLSKSKANSPLMVVAGRDLGNWVSPTSPITLGQRPADVWILNHPVVGLRAPATYRLRVTFRWTGAHGRVLGTAVRLTSKCFQPELRPDLTVQPPIAVQQIAGRPSLDQYVAVIRNLGATAAGQFEVLFVSGGPSPVIKHRVIQRLAAHASRQETFIGPACTATTAPTVTVDPLDQVDDANRSNNSLTTACPSS
jgi:hypothetical protein